MLVQFLTQPPGGVEATAWGGGGRGSESPLPVAVPCSPTTWPWELAVGSGLAACGWGRMAGLVWGFSLPGGPSRLCAEQTFRPDVGNMRNQFSGNSAAKPSTFGRETGLLSALGAQCLSHMENESGLLVVGGRASLAVRDQRKQSLGQALNPSALGGRLTVRV